MTEIVRSADPRLDELEAEMLNGIPVDCPLIHRFTPGMYIREIFMPKFTLLTSKIHLTEHPFVISAGAVSVKIDSGEWEYMKAPYSNITKSGTRRVLYIWEDCVWMTFHALPFIKGDESELSEDELNKVLKKVEDTILEPHTNEVLGQDANTVYKQLLMDIKLI